jgi:predicted dehydrogenase
MIGYALRFNTTFSTLKNEIANGSLGDIETAHAINISTGPFFHRAQGYAPVPVPEWWFNKNLTGGGALIDLGSHMINLLRWYLGEITDIKSHLKHRFNMDFEDSATCIAKFQTGTTATITVGWFSQQYQLKVELHGTAKNATAEPPKTNLLLTAAQMLITGKSSFYQPYLAELQYFTNCIINDTLPSPTGQDGLRDLEAIFLAYQNQLSLT